MTDREHFILFLIITGVPFIGGTILVIVDEMRAIRKYNKRINHPSMRKYR